MNSSIHSTNERDPTSKKNPGLGENLLADRKKKTGYLFCLLLIAVFFFLNQTSVFGQAVIRLPGTGINYEDSVRIVVLWNNPTGQCGWMDAVGAQTRDFILKSLSGGHINNPLTNPHIKIIPTHKANGTWTTWQDIKTLWGPDTLPHVIIHSNAGWGDANYNGPTTVNGQPGPIWALFDSAATHYIGITEIGDDASWMAKNTFGLALTENMPAPINDGTQYTAQTDSLLVGLHPKNDRVMDSTKYPFLNGVIRNTVFKVLNGDSTLYFKPYMGNNNGGKDTIRCQADADKYTILAGQESKLTMLGFENASHNGARVIAADPAQELNVVVAFQDTITKNGVKTVRRALALSIEPQFLKNSQAMYQLIYDGVMYASLAWQNRPPTKISMTVSPDTNVILAGDSIQYTAIVQDTNGNPISGYDQSVKWTLWTWTPPAAPIPVALPTPPGKSYLEATNGAKNTFKAIDAFTTYIIKSRLDTIVNGIRDTISWFDTVYVAPGPPTKLFIVSGPDSQGQLKDSARIGTLTFSSTTSLDSVYAVLRDRFGNWAGHATFASWLSRDTSAAKVAQGRAQLGEGIIQRKTAGSDTTFIKATQNGFSDSLQVILNSVIYSSVQIYVISGAVQPIDTLRMRTDQDTTVRARGLRADHSGVWDSLMAGWGYSSGLAFNNTAPTGGAYSWKFSPQTPATGFINISYSSGGAVLRDTVQAIFSSGNPYREALYPLPGKPDTGANRALDTSIVAIAGRPLQIVAKLFDNKNLWLAYYEAANAPFTWTVTEISGSGSTGSLSVANGFQTVFTAQRAYNTVRITASFQDGALSAPPRSVLVTVAPDTANHLVIEADTSRLISPQADNPLRTVSFSNTMQQDSVYAVLRDRFGNWAGLATSASWLSRDTTVVTAAPGRPQLGEGVITRKTAANDTTFIRAAKGSFSDSLRVILSNVSYSLVQIYVISGAVRSIDTLSMRTDQDTTLRARGLRADNSGIWDDLIVGWANSSGLVFNNTAPAAGAYSWKFTPQTPATGFINISYSSGGTVLRDTVQAVFSSGNPNREALYPSPGKPDIGANLALPASVVVTAGGPLQIVAKLFDNKNLWLANYETANAPFTWTITEVSGGVSTGSLSATNGFQTTFTAQKAYDTVRITASFQDGALSLPPQSILVIVAPDTADHIVIEADTSRLTSPHADNPLLTVSFSSAMLQDTVYAVLRDRFGNWVGLAASASWLSRDIAVVTAAPGRPQLGEGVITRNTSNNARTYLVAAHGNFTDSLPVILSDVTYASVQIYVLSGGAKPIDTLRMKTDQDTTVRARGLRADGSGIYDDISVRWANSPGLAFTAGAPATAVDAWKFNPKAPSTGTITIAYDAGGAELRDTLYVNFTSGDPYRMELYPLPGQPSANNRPYPPSVTITDTAGVPVQIVAKLFDNKNTWLVSYERADAPITWTISEVSGSGSTGQLDPLNGYKSSFTGRKANNVVKITASFQDGAITVPLQSIIIAVAAGSADHLVIEGENSQATSPNADNPLGTVSIGSAEINTSVYAIIRDKFGNWKDYSTATDWKSIDTNKAVVRPGNINAGEGIIIRRTSIGQTNVIAQDIAHTGAGYIDTVAVILNNVMYKSLRIVVRDSVDIQDLVMRTDQDTTLSVLGLRSDTARWEPVQANWSVVPAIKMSAAAPNGSRSWTFGPVDTGSGRIVVSLGSLVTPDTLSFRFAHGLPYKIAICPGPGAPVGSNAPYPGPATAITDTAGKSLPLTIKVFDKNNVWLDNYEGNASIIFKWNLKELSGVPPTAVPPLVNVVGFRSSFVPTRAYNSVYIIAVFDTTGAQYFDTIQVKVVSGAPRQLVIEADQNWLGSPNKANPVDSIKINSSETYRNVYALVRDSLGNFIKYSLQTDWTSINGMGAFDTSLVSAQNGLNSIGQGVVKRIGDNGAAWVIATSKEYSGLTDTIKAAIVKYFYTQLRIVGHGNVTGRAGELTMSTNDDTTLYVIGLRSDTAKWEPVSARWETSASVIAAPSAPERAVSWSFSPVSPGSGWIRATLGSDATTKPDTVQVTFTRGAPTSITINLITPPSRLVAGDTVIAVVEVRNKDGLVPGTLCDTTSYQEMLGKGGNNRPGSIAIIEDSATNLNQYPSSAGASRECFHNGLDTVKFVFYYAPFDKQDSTQKIFLDLGDLSASTESFNVLPGEMRTVAIQNLNAKDLDTIRLAYPDGAQVFTAAGFDAFGNKVALSNGAVWTQTNSLHAIDRPTNAARIYYDASEVKRDEQGFIIATVTDAKGNIVRDSTYVMITGGRTSLVSAITQDANGNGFLDRIVLHFDKDATIPRGFNIDSLIRVTYNYAGTDFTFHIDSIGGISSDGGITSQSRTDSVFTLYLSENNNPLPKIPQTAWTPTIAVSGLVGTNPVSNAVAVDGAGPVLWSVSKVVSSLTNRTTDLVSVTFSEPVQATDGSELKNKLSTSPGLVLYVWKRVGDSLVRDTILNGINEFYTVSSDGKTVSFYMKNGKDLSAQSYISLRPDSSLIVDQSRFTNSPATSNQKVQVQVVSNTPNVLSAGPNPAAPSFKHPGNPTLDYDYNINARQWARDDGGTVLSFDVSVSSGSDNKITGMLKIFDAIGNIVCEAGDNKKNLIPQFWQNGNKTVYHFDIYWNGLNARKTKVAPGIYQAILYLTRYSSGKASKEILSGTIGVRR